MLKLKRVEIHGFKSFYERTEMKFSGQGIAAVVGPNGCGKSNLSDAINWVLGEQSAKSLRGARMEDVIFAGTRERKALGMASVTMTLVPDNRLLPVNGAPTTALTEPTLQKDDTLAPLAEHMTVDDAGSHREDTDSSTETADLRGSTSGLVEKPFAPMVAGAERAAERQGEITITRRLYRSGESEYLINGKIARLRDIQDLFLGTGLGPESYAIIEQGRIGQILSNKPQDRRAVIEEAAGITKFKTRKRLAEAKLEGAKQNLSRVFDILEEVTRQVNSLKRQAAKTKRYGELKTEMAEYLRKVLAAKFKLLEREIAKTAIELNLATTELHAVTTSVASQEAAQTAVVEESYAIEAGLTEARKQFADLKVEAELARSKLEYQTRQVEQIDGRLQASATERQLLEDQGVELRAEAEQQGGELTRLTDEAVKAQTALEAKSRERQAAQGRLNERERELEAARSGVMRLLGETSSLKNRASQSEAQLGGLDREGARATSDEKQSESDLARIEGIRDEVSKRLTARQAQLISVTEQRVEADQALKGKRADLHVARQTLDRLRSEFSRVKARKDSLADVISHRSYTTETVKRLFNSLQKDQSSGFAPVGVLADFVDVDPLHEKATEEFLHEELEYVVVREWADAERGMDLLRAGTDGRATFVIEKLEEEAIADSASVVPDGREGVIGRLSSAMRFMNGLSEAPDRMLPRVANCYLTNDRWAAQRLAVEFPNLWFLAADGTSYHGQSVSGGRKTGAGPLALKRELREVSQLEKGKSQEVTGSEQALAGLEHEIAVLSEQLESLRQHQQSQEKDVLALDHETRKLAEEFQRVNGRLSAARLELDRVGRERGKLETALAEIRAELDQKETAKRECEQALEEARRSLQELQDSVARVTEEHASLRASLAGIEERQRSVSAAKARVESRIQETANRGMNLGRENEKLRSEREGFIANNTELTQRRREFGEWSSTLELKVAELDAKEADVRAQISAAEEELKRSRQSAMALQEARSGLQVTMARLDSDLKHLEETGQNELQSTLVELSANMETVPSAEELAQLDANYQELRRKIDSLGPVNAQALEEYEEALQRHEFLYAQRQDLLDSIRDTEKAIRDLDGESRRRFSEAFKVINANFTEMFKTLFGGGIAEMRLTDEENVSDSGIDIMASPPGKRLQSVLLLSGGEKALTAMALLMAVFQYTPSPFCVLDEVDAPLDEPNTQRLAKLLGAMSQQTQFIVITHAKRTMEVAQALYGITMQEPGVSKLVSVKFRASETASESGQLADTKDIARQQERELVVV